MMSMTPHVNYRILLIFLLVAFLVNVSNYILFSEQKWKGSLHPDTTSQTFPQTFAAVSDDALEQDDEEDITVKLRRTDALKQRLHASSSVPEATAEGDMTVSTLNADEVDGSDTSTSFVDDHDRMCPDLPPDLGLMPQLEEVLMTASKTNTLENVNPGGIYGGPQECTPKQKVAIIVPFRDVKKHLSPFLYYMHSFLIKQQLEYQIFVIEYFNQSAIFNRAQLYNIGFLESQRLRPNGLPCVVFVEAHLLPLDTRNLYRCGWYPRQLVTRVNKALRTPYDHNFGGVIAIKREQFQKVNGFPNEMIEDPNAAYEGLLKRIEFMNLTVETAPDRVGKYRSLKNIYRNKTESATTRTTEPYTTPAPVSLNEGLSTLSYEVAKTAQHRFYCHVSITLDDTIRVAESTVTPAIQI